MGEIKISRVKIRRVKMREKIRRVEMVGNTRCACRDCCNNDTSAGSNPFAKLQKSKWQASLRHSALEL
jgi:hypothetical protein